MPIPPGDEDGPRRRRRFRHPGLDRLEAVALAGYATLGAADGEAALRPAAQGSSARRPGGPARPRPPRLDHAPDERHRGLRGPGGPTRPPPDLPIILLTAKAQESEAGPGPGRRRRRLHRQALQPRRPPPPGHRPPRPGAGPVELSPPGLGHRLLGQPLELVAVERSTPSHPVEHAPAARHPPGGQVEVVADRGGRGGRRRPRGSAPTRAPTAPPTSPPATPPPAATPLRPRFARCPRPRGTRPGRRAGRPPAWRAPSPTGTAGPAGRVRRTPPAAAAPGRAPVPAPDGGERGRRRGRTRPHARPRRPR